jgi:hypothetical protein
VCHIKHVLNKIVYCLCVCRSYLSVPPLWLEPGPIFAANDEHDMHPGGGGGPSAGSAVRSSKHARQTAAAAAAALASKRNSMAAGEPPPAPGPRPRPSPDSVMAYDESETMRGDTEVYLEEEPIGACPPHSILLAFVHLLILLSFSTGFKLRSLPLLSELLYVDGSDGTTGRMGSYAAAAVGGGVGGGAGPAKRPRRDRSLGVLTQRFLKARQSIFTYYTLIRIYDLCRCFCWTAKSSRSTLPRPW